MPTRVKNSVLKTCLVVIPLPSQCEESDPDDYNIPASLGYFFSKDNCINENKMEPCGTCLQGNSFAVVTVISIHSVLCGRIFLAICPRL